MRHTQTAGAAAAIIGGTIFEVFTLLDDSTYLWHALWVPLWVINWCVLAFNLTGHDRSLRRSREAGYADGYAAGRRVGKPVLVEMPLGTTFTVGGASGERGN